MANKVMLPDYETYKKIMANLTTRNVEIAKNTKILMRIIDEQDAVNRYKWHNLPSGLNGQMLERILYYRGQGAFFKLSNDQFYFLPYNLNGSIDVYGRWTGITPLTFGGGETTTENEKDKKAVFIPGLVKKPIYDFPEELTEEIFENGCVLIHDYTKQLCETILPRYKIQDAVLEMMSEVFPLVRTQLINNCGVRAMRVQDENQAKEVENANEAIYRGAMSGRGLIPVVGATEMQNLSDGIGTKAEEYLLVLQSLDNFRLSCYGLDTGGFFQKKSHMLEAEQSMNAGHSNLIYQDGLTIRQNACDLINSIWGLGVWVEESESALAIDKNLDGVAVDENETTEVAKDIEMTGTGGEE